MKGLEGVSQAEDVTPNTGLVAEASLAHFRNTKKVSVVGS